MCALAKQIEKDFHFGDLTDPQVCKELIRDADGTAHTPAAERARWCR
jgi:hypothetical protein